MSRSWMSPALIVSVLVVVLAVLGYVPGGPWGEDAAFVVAAIWLFVLRRRRFAIACALAVCFVLAILATIAHLPIASTFGDGVIVAAVVVAATLRKPTASDDLRVLLVTRHDAGRVGGTEQYLRNFLRCADDPTARMRVTFCTFDQGLEHDAYAKTSFEERPGGWFFGYTRRHEAEVFARTPWNLAVLAMVVADLSAIAASAADERDVDVVYGVGGLIANSAAILTGMLIGKPSVCHFHYDFAFARFPAILARLLRAWFANARFVVANGQGTIEDLAQIGYPRDRMGVVLNWVFPEDMHRPARTDLRRDPSEKVALFVGRLVPEKGIELVMQATDRLPEGVRLVIAGGGPLDEVVERWTFEHPNALWLGEVPNAKIAELLGAADCLVWGSIDTYYLSFAAIEALAAGVPVIGSLRGTTLFGLGQPTLESTLPGSVGILCEPDAADLAAAIVEVCSWDRSSVASACREFANANYSPRNFDRLAGLLSRAAESERP